MPTSSTGTSFSEFNGFEETLASRGSLGLAHPGVCEKLWRVAHPSPFVGVIARPFAPEALFHTPPLPRCDIQPSPTY
jgi:hypothetical protein